ncbi:MAG TPA: phosphoribosylformylglycinamidine synthase II, partial [Brevibacterium sp.]|nr:phosphoribosylformylglycinamidine synthase II [Brevibacterium sp.]
RNLACVGADPAAITDCLNFGSPEKPEVFYTFHEAIRGLADACTELGVPVVSGNVSFYNEYQGAPILPTPAIGMVGVIDDLSAVIGSAFLSEGDTIVLLGETADELGGSEYLAGAHGLVTGALPELDLEHEATLGALMRDLIGDRLLHSAHDCSEGGLAVALAESCVGGRLGATVTLDDDLRPAASLFSETQGRIVVSVQDDDVDHVLDAAERYGVPYSVIGEVGGDRIVIEGKVDIALADAIDAFEESLGRLVGEV